MQALGVRSRRFLPELALIAATVAYGATFVIVQDALDDTTPAGFILLRFTVGTLALAPFAIRRGFRRAPVCITVRVRRSRMTSRSQRFNAQA